MSLLEIHRVPPRRARRPRSDTARVCWLLQAATAAAFDVPVDELRARSRRSADIAFARQSAMYLAHIALGLIYDAVGAQFRRDRTTAAYACRRVEDRRDDPAVDRALQTLEDVCGGLKHAVAAQPRVQP